MRKPYFILLVLLAVVVCMSLPARSVLLKDYTLGISTTSQAQMPRNLGRRGWEMSARTSYDLIISTYQVSFATHVVNGLFVPSINGVVQTGEIFDVWTSSFFILISSPAAPATSTLSGTVYIREKN